MELAAPGSLPGHHDLETLAQHSPVAEANLLDDAATLDITSGRLETPDGDLNGAILRLRQAMSVGEPTIDHLTLRRSITGSLGFAAVLAAELHNEDWLLNEPVLPLSLPPGSAASLNRRIRQQAVQYLRKREILGDIVRAFAWEVLAPTTQTVDTAINIAAFGLKQIDEDLQRRYVAANMAAMYKQFDNIIS